MSATFSISNLLSWAPRLLVAASLVALISGCVEEKKGSDWASGGDHKRDLAKKIPIGRTVTDRVNAPAGDNTDWKYIDIEEDGKLKIVVSVDNPNVNGTVMVYDELGQPIERRTITPENQLSEFEIPVEKGKKYYVQMAVSKYETSYSVGNTFEKKEEATAIVIREEAPAPRVYVAPRKKDVPPPPKEEEPKEDPTKVVVTTVILNVIPWKEGKASRITFQQGSDAGIKRGGVVAISSGGSCIVKEVYPGTSICFVEKEPSSFKEGTRVVITSEK